MLVLVTQVFVQGTVGVGVDGSGGTRSGWAPVFLASKRVLEVDSTLHPDFMESKSC